MKERKVITFAEGIVTTPSSGKDGEMKDCVNVIPVNGELRNIEDVKETNKYLDSPLDALLYVHKLLSGEEHLIFLYGHDVKWCSTSGSSSTAVLQMGENENVVSVNSMNNVLIILTNKQLKYYLWDSLAGSYKGVSTSEGRNLNLRFGLVGTIRERNYNTDINFSVLNPEHSFPIVFTPTEENYNALFGAINKYEQEIKEANSFIFPFFIRYALKTKDGNYICPSAPVLMIPNTQQVPCPYILAENGEIAVGDYQLYLKAVRAQIYYAVGNTNAQLQAIREAIGDIVDSVVVAVTPPLYTYDYGSTNTEKEKWIKAVIAPSTEQSDDYNFGVYSSNDSATPLDPDTDTEPTHFKYQRHDGSVVVNDSSLQTTRRLIIELPLVDFKEQLNSSSVFRIITEIKLEDLEAQAGEDDYIKLDIPNGRIASLDGLPRLSDDVISLSHYHANTSFEYNSRYYIADLLRTLWRGYYPDMMQGLSDRANNVYVRTHFKAVVEVVKNSESHFVECNYGYLCDKLYWFYYPDKDARRVTIYRGIVNNGEYQTTGVATLSLTVHDILNGAYWFDDYNAIEFESVESEPDIETNPNVNEPHTMLGSEPFSPTIFASDNVINVGRGEIKAVSAISLPISEPFGKTPMVAFCTDGVWGLSLKDDGRFAAEQQLSGDILTDGTEPVQSDKAVFFLTEQGLKAFTGGVPTLLSEKMDEKVEYGNGAHGANVIFDFLSDVCKEGTMMMWDYAHDFLHLFPGVEVTAASAFPQNPNAGDIIYLTQDVTITDTDPVSGETISVTYAAGLYKYDGEWEATKLNQYVYNVRTGQFARKENGWAAAEIVQSYPVVYLQKVGVANLFTTERNKNNTTAKSGVAVTREEPFGDGSTMKVLTDMKLLKVLTKQTSQVRVSVEVSNDRKNWYALRSLRAHGWLWYRFILTTSMVDDESVQGVLTEYETRRTNKLRG